MHFYGKFLHDLGKETLLLIDSHSHSRFSFDSEADCEDNILAAMARGLDGLAFTDHIDRVDGPLDYCFDFDDYTRTLIPLKARYKDRILVLIGAEMGLNLEKNHWIEAAMKDDRFDYFIGSLHTVDNQDVASTLYTYKGDLKPFTETITTPWSMPPRARRAITFWVTWIIWTATCGTRRPFPPSPFTRSRWRRCLSI